MDGLSPGVLSKVHHYALNVQDMAASRRFYGELLGLHELQGSEIPATLKDLVAAGKLANFRLPDGVILDLFGEPELGPPDQNPRQQFTRANHLAFDIAPELFDRAVEVLHQTTSISTMAPSPDRRAGASTSTIPMGFC